MCRIADLCVRHGWALIVDEVFADYVLEADDPLTDLAGRTDAVTFTLGGASKALGLPQIKLGWITLGGDPALRGRAKAGLELIADTFLSVGTPVQVAAADLLGNAVGIRAAIQARIRANLETIRQAVQAVPACQLLRAEGGWSAVIRVPALRSEEQLVLELLMNERILVHPGYFFDFAHEAYIVVSLLPPEHVFRSGLERALAYASTPPAH